ncbi:YraN family protein [Alcaligenaceae bacterium]|nr:YraN family protein [Alcaligenaceae bacterium]
MTDDAIVYQLALAARQKKRRKRPKSLASPQQRATPQRLPEERGYSPAQRQGRQAEDRALALLEAEGLRILGRNLCCKGGEIDLVALDGNTLVFVEVRHRTHLQFGSAAASVNLQKQRRLVRAAHYFLPTLARRHFGGHMPRCRFDLVCDEPGGLTWLQHVFNE